MKTCSTCRWYRGFPDECCENGGSERFGDWVGLETTCEEWAAVESGLGRKGGPHGWQQKSRNA